MTTIVVKSIGTAGRDYSTLQAWEDACPADLLGADQIWKGECYNDSEFTSGVNFNGTNWGPSTYLWLTCAAGQSFRDHAGKLTNALRYDQSKGVGIRVTGNYKTILVGTGFKVDGLQMYYDSTYSSNYFVPVSSSAANFCTLSNSLLQTRRTSSRSASTMVLVNSLFIELGTSFANSAAAEVSAYNCTFVRPSDLGAAGTGVVLPYAGKTIKNCAIFGFSNSITAPSGATAADNATDAATIYGSGTTGLSYSAQFQNTTTAAADFRVKAGNGLGVGSRDAANTADLDIVGQARSLTTPTIGAWEYIAAGGTAGSTPRRAGAKFSNLLAMN